jgi:hypothetical protein
LGKPTNKAIDISLAVARNQKFFHWELEYPDVFTSIGAGFDALLGNPPWDIAKATGKEFFSNIDPLFRTYGKQNALAVQRVLFGECKEREEDWLKYCDQFKCLSNWISYAGHPFGDGIKVDGGRELQLGRPSEKLHEVWVSRRSKDLGFSSTEHPYNLQGSGEVSLYKCFTELGLCLLRPNGRMGLIVPGGIYADNGSKDLRASMLDVNGLEWVFNFENRKKVFEIDSRFKFNPIIVNRSGKTDSIKVAFLRQDLSDWSLGVAESLSGEMDVATIHHFSPGQLAVPEVRDEKDLTFFLKCYESPPLTAGHWKWKYHCEFHAANDSDRFSELKLWSEKGYLQDIYGRWIKGNWKKEAGRIVSKDGSLSIDTDGITGISYPVYEGKTIWQYDPAYSAPPPNGRGKWVPVPWEGKYIYSRYLMSSREHTPKHKGKLIIRNVSSPTNQRTFIASIVPDYPCIDKAPILVYGEENTVQMLALSTALNSLIFDAVVRIRFAPSGGGGSIILGLIEELPVWNPSQVGGEIVKALAAIGAALTGGLPMLSPIYAALPLNLQRFVATSTLKQFDAERLRLRCISDAINAVLYGVGSDDFRHIVAECWHPQAALASKSFTRSLFPKLYWRVDKDKPPQLRHTVLAFKAFVDLSEEVSRRGSLESAILAFTGLEGGPGWQFPEHLDSEELGFQCKPWRLPVRTLLPGAAEPSAEMVVARTVAWRDHSKILGFA